ncbi:hypothetical protein K1719_018174 [Acacia pycnantha]|nr:hypothetical protein K1719_018174 [Acacia pycnantha]
MSKHEDKPLLLSQLMESEGDTQQANKQEDRHQRLLGGRENFVLHTDVAVLSFLIFVAVPVVIYGKLIGENYSSEVKVTEVVAASLVCIILLATGKVYTKRQPKSYVKTLSYLCCLGGCNFGSVLCKDLIEKLGKLESGFAIPLPVSESAEREPPWTSF